MRRVGYVLTVALIAWGFPLWAQDSPSVVEAQAPAGGAAAAAAAAAPTTTAEPPDVVPPGDTSLTPEQLQLLNQKIDVGRINIDRLREVLEGEAGAETVRMSLHDCIQVAVDKNPELQIVRYEPLKSSADILTASGEFDPVASTNIMHLHSLQAASPEYQRFGDLAVYDVYRTTSKYSVSGKLRWGTVYDASMELDNEKTTLTGFRQQWSGGLTLTLSQPLLRGRGSAVNLARIHMAEKARRISEQQLRLTVMNVVSEVVKAYWDLVGAVESVSVREQALGNAERLLEISQKRLNIGTGAAIEVLQAKAGVATRQTDLIAARSQIASAEDLLKQILNLRDGDVFSAKRILPTDRPGVKEFNLEDLRNADEQLKKSMELALKNRPEISSSQLEIETAKLDRTRTANAMLPDISVSGSVFQGERGSYPANVFSGVLDRTDNAYTVNVKGSVSLGNRAARGAFTRADLTTRQAEQKLDRTKQELMLRIRLASRTVNTSQILVESNREVCKLQETNVAAEEKRLRLGLSTSYRVLQVQTDLTAAQTQEVQARIAYEKALVDLRLAEGTILDSLGIEFLPPEPECPVNYFRSLVPCEPE